MMRVQMMIKPVGEYWAVSVDGVENQLLFAKGSRAERSARGLAERLSQAGYSVDLEIWGRNDNLGGRLHWNAAAMK